MNYNKSAINYDRLLAPLEKRFLSNWRREALSYLPENADLLEIGAGTGLNFRFYPDCKHAVASEISCEMLRFARQKMPEMNLSLIQTDAQLLPFADNSFDAAFATLVFCAIPEPERAFLELRRIVKPKGRIVLLEHVRPNGLAGYVFDLLNLFTARIFGDHFNRETAETAKSSGLEIIKVDKKAFGIFNLIIADNR